MHATSKTFILIDASYFIFYRFHALVQWWKFAKKDEPLGNPSENQEFITKFKTIFMDKCREIPKKLKCKDAKIIVAKDCPRKNIWRNKLFSLFDTYNIISEEELHTQLNNIDTIAINNENVPDISSYKGGRKQDPIINAGPFFKIVYNEELFQKAGITTILNHPELEADDCIALALRYYTSNAENQQHIIIANDHDYLQLVSPTIRLINLKYREIPCENPEAALFMKCVQGDKSDNIKGIFKRCGKKTALVYYEDNTKFKKQLQKEPGSYKRYLINQRIINFKWIPEKFVQEFYQQNFDI
tara:strand:- start:679 stop:1578 length:900 start_codon:yes stop_codon:yes gene_type:complete